MEDEEAADDLRGRELSSEDEEGQIGTDERDRDHHRIDHPQPGPAEQVVRQRIAGDAHRQGQQEQSDADEPVDLAWPAEGAGEEDAQQVHHDGGYEDQRGPVVDLAHHQSGAHLEAQAHHRVVRG